MPEITNILNLRPVFLQIGSCRGLQRYNQTAQDGEYELILKGRKVQIYCHDMNTDNPKEFVTLKGNAQAYVPYLRL